MATSRAPATIDRLVELLTPAVGDNGNVWDGPRLSGDLRPSLYVGYDGDPEGDFKTVDPSQEWAGLGARTRDEEFDIPCAVVALIGDDNTKLARDAVYTLLAIAEDTLRADPSLGQTPTPYVAEFRPGPVHTEPGETGYQVRGVFSVHVKTRLYTT
jgi:hypothetical protein